MSRGMAGPALSFKPLRPEPASVMTRRMTMRIRLGLVLLLLVGT